MHRYLQQYRKGAEKEEALRVRYEFGLSTFHFNVVMSACMRAGKVRSNDSARSTNAITCTCDCACTSVCVCMTQRARSFISHLLLPLLFFSPSPSLFLPLPLLSTLPTTYSTYHLRYLPPTLPATYSTYHLRYLPPALPATYSTYHLLYLPSTLPGADAYARRSHGGMSR